MNSIDRWVIRTALSCRRELYADSPECRLSINLSGNSLNDDDLLTYVQEQFAQSGTPPEQVCFEITETAAVLNLGAAARFVSALKEAGCRFALDDFGSGLSSFMYLKNLPVDYVKIDGSFVRDIADNDTDRALVAAVNQAAHAMGIETIAEYAESSACVSVLKEMQVDYVQGNALGRPRPLV